MEPDQEEDRIVCEVFCNTSAFFKNRFKPVDVSYSLLKCHGYFFLGIFFSFFKTVFRFTIDNETGHMNVNTSLDREQRNSYTITVKARDIKNFEGSTQLTVTVTDENDENPKFMEPSYQAEVKENGKSFKVPLIVKVNSGFQPYSYLTFILFRLFF